VELHNFALGGATLNIFSVLFLACLTPFKICTMIKLFSFYL
jgi:hypothetical protein